MEYTCHVREITCYNDNIGMKKKKILILQRIVGTNDNFKKLTMTLTNYLGMSTFQKGVIWGVFVLYWLVRVSRNERSCQYFRCDQIVQFSEIGTIACRPYNFHPD